MENTKRGFLPLRKAPCKALSFLRQVKRTRLIAAILSALAALWCMWWLYDQEFHYANTDAGRLAALENYIPAPPDSGSTVHSPAVRAGTPLRTVAHAAHGKHLYIYYAAQNQDHVHGILHLVRGINGKYRPLSASMDPFPYTAGVKGQEIGNGNTSGNRDTRFYALAGDSCDGIHAAAVTFRGSLKNSSQEYTWEKTYPIEEPDFLWLIEWNTLEAELGIQEGRLLSVMADDIRLLNQEGEDITSQFRDEGGNTNYSSGKSTAELFLVYVFMGIAGALGLVFIRYFLRRD